MGALYFLVSFSVPRWGDIVTWVSVGWERGPRGSIIHVVDCHGNRQSCKSMHATDAGYSRLAV
jgi:hypothetical protein